MKKNFPIKYYEFIARKNEILNQNIIGKYINVGYIARLIEGILERSNFSKTENIEEANIINGSDLTKDQINLLKPFQKYSHFLNKFDLGSKSGYDQIMKELMIKTNENFLFYPESYYLPNDLDLFRNNFNNSKNWILKPSGGSRGEGITIINEFSINTTESFIAQKYIENPLLINGYKFDLRFYVALISIDPLKIYIYENGLVRIASDKYEDNSIHNLTAHLTNFSINKINSNFKTTENIEEDGKGNKWSHKPFWPFLESQGFNIQEIKEKIENSIIIVLMASRSKLMDQPNHQQSFELFGFDIMIDKFGNIFILEINVSPSLGVPSKLDLEIKGPLIKDFYNISLIPIKETFIELNNEIKIINEFELSNNRLGSFKCIYPIKNKINLFEKYMNYTTNDLILNKYLEN